MRFFRSPRTSMAGKMLAPFSYEVNIAAAPTPACSPHPNPLPEGEGAGRPFDKLSGRAAQGNHKGCPYGPHREGATFDKVSG